MLKVFIIDVETEDNLTELKDWLTERLGTENVRWWYTNLHRGMWDPSKAEWSNPRFRVTLDVTDEEEPTVTAFALRWA
jgi:ribulose kinase